MTPIFAAAGYITHFTLVAPVFGHVPTIRQGVFVTTTSSRKPRLCNFPVSRLFNGFLTLASPGTRLAKVVFQKMEKGGELMKTAISFLAALLLIGSIGGNRAYAAAEGVIFNATLSPGSYCHLTFPAIREDTLSWGRPVLKAPSDGDIIDFYGPCDHDPLGNDQIKSQKRRAADRYEND
jgi:hypothetical protein